MDHLDLETEMVSNDLYPLTAGKWQTVHFEVSYMTDKPFLMNIQS